MKNAKFQTISDASFVDLFRDFKWLDGLHPRRINEADFISVKSETEPTVQFGILPQTACYNYMYST